MDERELIEAAIAHLQRIGVDHVLVCDMGSTDGTWEILEKHRSATFDVVRMSNSDSPTDYDRANLELVQRLPADWVMFLDADEFWLPATGALRDCTALAEHDVVRVHRYNVPLGHAGPMIALPPTPSRYADAFLYIEPVDDLRQHLQANPATPWSSGVPVPKVIARRDCIQGFAPGMHDVTTAPTVRRASATDLLVAHLPFTTQSRFERKVENIREVHRHHPTYASGQHGWHWVRWVELADAGLLPEEFERQRLGLPALAQLHSRGAVRTAEELLRGALVP
jgi:hypothetical protein